jgi:predicted dehydrogenase
MLPRRNFLAATAAVTTTATSSSAQETKQEASSEKPRPIRIGIMGLSRGMGLATDAANLPNIEVAYLCDVDEARMSSAAKQFSDKFKSTPQTVNDFRKILDDKSIDALFCAAPNHWHGPATIMACKAGKHVYVEKPCSHNPQEGEWMIAAAAKYKRCVQMGTQRRSAPGTRAAIDKLHAGAIGNVFLSRCFYTGLRGSIGKEVDGQSPQGLDYDLWQGPAKHIPYRKNYVPYNWHWFWHWGGGELANNGVHGLDLCRWGLQVDYPTRSVSSGGRYWFDDDQETPDTQTACFEFTDGRQIVWSATSCNNHRPGFFCAFYGDKGTLELDGEGSYRIFDRQDKMTEEGRENSVGGVEHLQNFFDCIRDENPSGLNQPIVEAHKSTLLCHLGNIAQRTGRTVNSDPQNGRILNDADQQKLWTREYDPAWKEMVSMP